MEKTDMLNKIDRDFLTFKYLLKTEKDNERCCMLSGALAYIEMLKEYIEKSN